MLSTDDQQAPGRAHSDARVAVGVSVIGIATLCVAGALPGSPLQATPGAGHPDLIVAAIMGTAAALGGFLVVVRQAWRGTVPVRTAVWLAVAVHAVVLLLPLLYSRDVFSYALFGRIVTIHHLNPYVTRPIDVRSDPFFAMAGPAWTHTTSVYGPAFTWLSGAIARWIGSARGTLLAYRALAAAASLATVLLVARAASELRPRRASFAVVLLGVNPVVVFLTVASAHNDALVALSVAAAFTLVVARRPVAATAVLTLGLLVKDPAAVPLLILVSADVAGRPAGARLRRLAAHVGVVVVLASAAAAPFLQRHDPTLGQRQLADHVGGIAPLNWVRAVLEGIGKQLGTSGGEAANELMRVISIGLLVAVVAALAWATARRALRGDLTPAALGVAWAWGLLAFQLLALSFLPWYMIWLLPVAWLLPRVALRLIVALSVLQVCSLVVVDPVVYPVAEVRGALIAVSVLAPIALVLGVPSARELVRRLRRSIALEADAEDRTPVVASIRSLSTAPVREPWSRSFWSAWRSAKVPTARSKTSPEPR